MIRRTVLVKINGATHQRRRGVIVAGEKLDRTENHPCVGTIRLVHDDLPADVRGILKPSASVMVKRDIESFGYVHLIELAHAAFLAPIKSR